jgi:rod shape-determining protein MreC
MLPVPSRHRSLTLFAVAIAAQVLFLAIQIRRGQQVRLIRVWAIESVSPLGRGAAWSVDGIRGLWNNYVALRHMREENDQLRKEMGTLKIRNEQLESRAAEADRLANLLGFRDQHAEVQMLAARVIGATPDPSSHMVLIDRGTRDGVRRDMGIITPEGVVGKVLAVYPDTSQVLLLSDKESGVGALLEASRAQGPVKGTGEPLLGLEYIGNDTKVQPGEVVLTSGQDRIFPKDLPVGTVVEVHPDHKGPFQTILVKPAAQLDGLEEVLVLLTRQEFTARKDAETSGHAPAAPAPPAKGTSTAVPAKPPVTQTAKLPVAALPAKPAPATVPAKPPVAPPPKPAVSATSPTPSTQETPGKPETPETSEAPNNP